MDPQPGKLALLYDIERVVGWFAARSRSTPRGPGWNSPVLIDAAACNPTGRSMLVARAAARRSKDHRCPPTRTVLRGAWFASLDDENQNNRQLERGGCARAFPMVL